MRALITGITGFAGSHLAEYLLAEHPDVQVFGTYRWRSRMENIEHFRSRVKLLECDLRDYTSVHAALAASRPDYIFHLAAQSFVPSSWTAPNDTLTTNVSGQTNLFEAVRALRLDPVIQIACSSEQYGLVLPHETPIKETNPLRPLSPYAVSKVAQDYLGYQYFQSYGIRPSAPAASTIPGRGAGRSSSPPTSAARWRRSSSGSRSRSSASATSTRSATSPMCATWCAPTGWR